MGSEDFGNTIDVSMLRHWKFQMAWFPKAIQSKYTIARCPNKWGKATKTSNICRCLSLKADDIDSTVFRGEFQIARGFSAFTNGFFPCGQPHLSCFFLVSYSPYLTVQVITSKVILFCQYTTVGNKLHIVTSSNPPTSLRLGSGEKSHRKPQYLKDFEANHRVFATCPIACPSHQSNDKLETRICILEIASALWFIGLQKFYMGYSDTQFCIAGDWFKDVWSSEVSTPGKAWDIGRLDDCVVSYPQ